MAIFFETSSFRLALDERAQTVSFVDLSSGCNYVREAAPFARIWCSGKERVGTAATRKGDLIQLDFGDSSVTARIRVKPQPQYLLMEVLGVEGPGIDRFRFVDIPLTLRGRPDEPFCGCALALNLLTNVEELPGPSPRLQATAYSRLGFAGARVAILGFPPDQLRGALQKTILDAPDIPHSPLGGPWALDAAQNRGSYLFNFGDVTEETVGQWIELLRSLGFTQLDFHGGTSFRFGDCRPNPKMYPRGRDSLKAVIDRLHDAGFLAGLHTYAFFLDKSCPWVSPVPDPRMAKDASFTLARPLTPDTDPIAVQEDLSGMSTITGFFVRNSVTLRIEDELITYGGISRNSPHAFTGCRRGAWGTKASAHGPAAEVHHLKECFGLFAPDGDSTLLADVAAQNADFFNECGFDMIYLDALDGEDVLGGPEYGWHYGSRFVFELWKRLKKPALLEMSTFHHHLWLLRSRLGAWDHPTRGHKRFIDLHLEANEGCRRIFLPAHLGWWAIRSWNGVQDEPTFFDDIEYLCGKCLGTDTGFSLMGIDPGSLAAKPAVKRLARLIQRYESLRASGSIPPEVKAALSVPGAEFRLVEAADGKAELRRAHYVKFKAEGLEGPAPVFRARFNHPFRTSPLLLRIETLFSAVPYSSPQNTTLAQSNDPAEFPNTAREEGMAIELRPSDLLTPAGERSGCWWAWRSGQAPPSAASVSEGALKLHGTRSDALQSSGWACLAKVFSPPLALGENQALGVWIHGNGQGQRLNFQLRSPEHVSGGLADHYVDVSFTGWHYFELVETESERSEECLWPYSRDGIYRIYRETVNFKQVESLSLWVNRIAGERPVSCHLGPLKALRVMKATVSNPSITLGGKTLTFPADIESGSYLEFFSLEDCKLYSAQGAVLSEVRPVGEVPLAAAGENELLFACQARPGARVRSRITLMTEGERVHIFD